MINLCNGPLQPLKRMSWSYALLQMSNKPFIHSQCRSVMKPTKWKWFQTKALKGFQTKSPAKPERRKLPEMSKKLNIQQYMYIINFDMYIYKFWHSEERKELGLKLILSTLPDTPGRFCSGIGRFIECKKKKKIEHTFYCHLMSFAFKDKICMKSL